MSAPFLGQIMIFAGNFAPRGWAFCDGQLLAISSNQSLFSLLGTTYGGDGETTFGLPDLRGRVPVFGKSNHTIRLGERGGAERHTLTTAELPSHSHTVAASNAPASLGEPSGGYWAASPAENAYGTVADPAVQPAANGVLAAATQAHDNMQPFLVMNMVIALTGIYPSPN